MKMIFGLLFLISCSLVMPSSYRSHLSDAWYPSRAKTLRNALKNLQDQAAVKYSCHLSSSGIKALLVPHAGYDYSGVIAASAYQNVRPGIFKRVIVLAPSHHVPFQGVALPGREYDSFKNSLGKILLDVVMLKALQKDQSGLFHCNQQAHESEHSVEVQIPFIQKYCGECAIVPLLVGSVGDDGIQKIAQTLQPFLDDTTLVIATSDLTHYGVSFGYTPFTSSSSSLSVGRQIVALDDQLVEQIQNLNGPGFMSLKRATGATVCGAQPIALLLALFQLDKNSTRGFSDKNINTYVTGYDRSSAQQENPEHSVSYVGIIFSTKQRKTLPLGDQLTGYEKNILRGLVDMTLRNLFTNSSECAAVGVLTQSLRAHQGAFVTLYGPGHRLRGCIGTIEPEQKPLYQTVCDMTRSAALHDSRFLPVKSSELKDITSSISVLTKPQKVSSYHGIRLGIDGVILKYQTKSALFLPKVAVEFGWDLTTMLKHLSEKAGLDSNAFKDEKAQFELFQSIDFS